MANKPKKLAICLDGTWNNPYQTALRDDGSKVLKPSNPLKMARAILPWNENQEQAQLTYYDSGVGALGIYPGLSNRIVGFVDNKLGGIWGAGFEANVEQAATFLVNNYLEGDQVFVFGFSRGAAQARGLTLFLDWMGGIPSKRDAYYLPIYYRAFLDALGKAPAGRSKSSIEKECDDPLVPIKIDFLGVWDTVMALGSRFLAEKSTSTLERSFHVDEKPAKCVKHARQALAVDEKRYDFRPEIWLGSQDNQTLEQRWFAGVHANIGGGYIHDGLANIAFLWLFQEAGKLGLATDKKFTDHYKSYPQAQLYKSRTLLYKIVELIRFRRGRGVRTLVDYPEAAALSLNKTVIQRMISDPAEHDQLDLYRPANIVALLRTHKADLQGFFESIGLDPDNTILPPDVLQAL